MAGCHKWGRCNCARRLACCTLRGADATMPPIRSDQPLVPSVLDRLLDDAPETTTEPARSRAQLLRDLKQSVRRDLEDLLNTRRRHLDLPPGLAELDHSPLAYGIPDF